MFYYLWIIKIIYIDPPAAPLDRADGKGLSAVLLITALFTVLFVFSPMSSGRSSAGPMPPRNR